MRFQTTDINFINPGIIAAKSKRNDKKNSPETELMQKSLVEEEDDDGVLDERAVLIRKRKTMGGTHRHKKPKLNEEW